MKNTQFPLFIGLFIAFLTALVSCGKAKNEPNSVGFILPNNLYYVNVEFLALAPLMPEDITSA